MYEVIVFGSVVYQVSERELQILNKKNEEIKKSETNDLDNLHKLTIELYDYLTKNVVRYKRIGEIQFDFRL